VTSGAPPQVSGLERRGLVDTGRERRRSDPLPDELDHLADVELLVDACRTDRDVDQGQHIALDVVAERADHDVDVGGAGIGEAPQAEGGQAHEQDAAHRFPPSDFLFV
jgi:hypothetical protein